MKYDELKNELVKSGQFKEMREDDYRIYTLCKDYKVKQIIMRQKWGEKYEAFKLLMDARRKAVKKICEQWKYYADRKYGIYFITFTYDPKKHPEIDKKKMKDMATKVLRALGIDYSINEDYGKKNGQYHLHAILYANEWEAAQIQREEGAHITFECEELKEYNEKYGYTDIKEVRRDDVKALGRYIAKFQYHAVKVKQNRISVRKDTPYQEYKAKNEKAKKYRKNNYDMNSLPKHLLEGTEFEYMFTRQWEDEVLKKDIKENEDGLIKFLKIYKIKE